MLHFVEHHQQFADDCRIVAVQYVVHYGCELCQGSMQVLGQRAIQIHGLPLYAGAACRQHNIIERLPYGRSTGILDIQLSGVADVPEANMVCVEEVPRAPLAVLGGIWRTEKTS